MSVKSSSSSLSETRRASLVGTGFSVVKCSSSTSVSLTILAVIQGVWY